MARSAISALREMRSDLLGFLRFLVIHKVVDNGGPAYTIVDQLNRADEQDRLVRWAYKTGKIGLRLTTNSVVCPADAKSLACTLDIQVAGEIRLEKAASAEPQWSITRTQMSFDFSAESSREGTGWSQFWHLDTHVDKRPAAPPAEPHPMFHLHFGGREMASRRLAQKGYWGKMLEMRGPRFAHPPMDLILALDFILSNATGSRWKDEFCAAKEYNRAVCNSQRRFWKPYKKALFQFYDARPLEQKAHLARLFWPNLRVNET